MKVYLLWHIYELEDDIGIHDEEKLIGVFSSRDRAKEAIKVLKDKEGFRDHPLKCFEIHETEVDRTSWTEGFSTVYYGK